MPRSKGERDLDAALKRLFPHEPVLSDYSIKCSRSTLYVDRVLLGLRLAIEVDGLQHSRFIERFHGDAEGFAESKRRDQLKESWLADNGFTLIRFKHDEKITVALLRKKFLQAVKHDEED